ncbi:MAG TPA: hypothetical protein PLH92_13615 [Mycobacterium sp.]|nr:hypothetical protein [Mycobacterium sp.]HQC77745.1 hypothetical protein [Mycobacterium sp.]
MTNFDAAQRRDVEKRWHDPETFRAAARYVVSVVVLAALAFAAMAAWHSLLAAILVPVILFVGSMGALLRTYQLWKSGGVWAIWHGASWILLVLLMFFFDLPLALR